MNTDSQVQQDAIAELKWEPLLREAEIGVSVVNGVVTLTGTVDGYVKKTEAEAAMKRVVGVRSVVEKIEVRYASHGAQRTDSDIASEIINAFKWNWEVPASEVASRVEKGWVTLEGVVEWKFQSNAAQEAVRSLTGVAGVTNHITVKSRSEDRAQQTDIESALRRNWSVADLDIKVAVSGHKATLIGTVHSWYQKNEAERIAWNAPGVWNVANELVVAHAAD